MIENDEIIYRLITKKNQTNSINAFVKKITHLFGKQKIFFKKYLYLPEEHENFECLEDFTRLRLLTYQTF